MIVMDATEISYFSKEKKAKLGRRFELSNVSIKRQAKGAVSFSKFKKKL